MSDTERGSTLNFGMRCQMPAVTVDGRSYSIGYENMSTEHMKGIPIRRDGKVIGHVETARDGVVTVKLNEGETLDLDSSPDISTSLRGLGYISKAMEGKILEFVSDDFSKAFRPEAFVREMPKGGYYTGCRSQGYKGGIYYMVDIPKSRGTPPVS